jgi:hypothetical protein
MYERVIPTQLLDVTDIIREGAVIRSWLQAPLPPPPPQSASRARGHNFLTSFSTLSPLCITVDPSRFQLPVYDLDGDKYDEVPSGGHKEMSSILADR